MAESILNFFFVFYFFGGGGGGGGATSERQLVKGQEIFVKIIILSIFVLEIVPGIHIRSRLVVRDDQNIVRTTKIT